MQALFDEDALLIIDSFMEVATADVTMEKYAAYTARGEVHVFFVQTTIDKGHPGLEARLVSGQCKNLPDKTEAWASIQGNMINS